MLQAVIRDDEIGTVCNEHGRPACPIRIDDDRAAGPHGDQHGFVAYGCRIAARIDTHGRTRLAAAIASAHNAGRETTTGERIRQPDGDGGLARAAGSDIAYDNDGDFGMARAHQAGAVKEPPRR